VVSVGGSAQPPQTGEIEVFAMIDASMTVGTILPVRTKVVSDPRKLKIAHPTTGRTAAIADMEERFGARPVEVEPVTDGWEVKEILPLHTLYGPQGKRIIEVVEKLEDFAAADELDTRWSYEFDITTYNEPIRYAALAALDALQKAGADVNWWADQSFYDGWGAEVIALAARDLIDTVPGWTVAAYVMIARPYRAAFRELLHPDDGECPVGGPWHLGISPQERNYTDDDVVRAIVRELGHDGTGMLRGRPLHEIIMVLKNFEQHERQLRSLRHSLATVRSEANRLLDEIEYRSR
jgi:hypothetical protein